MEKVRSAARAATKRRGAMRGWVGMKRNGAVRRCLSKSWSHGLAWHSWSAKRDPRLVEMSSAARSAWQWHTIYYLVT
jgi:hypothetical protein